MTITKEETGESEETSLPRGGGQLGIRSALNCGG